MDTAGCVRGCNMLDLLILIPLLILIFINMPFFKDIIRKAGSFIVIGFGVTQGVLFITADNKFWSHHIDLLDSLFNFSFIDIDGISRVYLVCTGMVISLALITAKGLIKDDDRIFNLVNVFLIALMGLNGLVIVKDIVSLYVFIEVVTVASIILIAFDKSMDQFEAGFKYLIFSIVASVLMLLAIGLILLITGSTEFSVINKVLRGSPHDTFIMFSLGMFLCGCLIKAGLAPFHPFIPDAYESASHPVAVFLAGIATKGVGLYALMRILYSVFIFESSVKTVLMVIGILSILAGAIACLGQREFKRMLAYSSISQMGYIILGFGCGTQIGIFGALFHLFNHSILKSLLFINSAAIFERTGTNDIEKTTGLMQKMPITGMSMIVAGLSGAGIPPLSGFWSKLIIVIALWSAGYYSYAVIAILASVLTLMYFISTQRKILFGRINEGFKDIKEIGFNIAFSEVLLSVVIIGIGVLFPFFWKAFFKI